MEISPHNLGDGESVNIRENSVLRNELKEGLD